MLKSLSKRGDKKDMSERQQILEMLASGKISVEDAEKLLGAVGDVAGPSDSIEPTKVPMKGKVRFLRVICSEDGTEKVDVRVPVGLIRAGMKFKTLIPQDVQSKIDDSLREKGMQFSLSDIKPDEIDEFIDALGEFSVNVNDGGDGVRVFCE